MDTPFSIRKYLLTHPLSIEILFLLAEEEKLAVSDIAKKLDRAVSTVYQPLKELEKIGILNSHKIGRKRMFILNDIYTENSLINDEKIINAYKNNTNILKIHSRYLVNYINNGVYDEISSLFDVKMNEQINGHINILKMNFLIKVNDGNIGVHIFLFEGLDFRHQIYNMLGETMDILLGENDLSKLILFPIFVIDENNKIMENIDRWKFNNFENVLNVNNKNVVLITNKLYKKELYTKPFYEWIKNEIVNEIEFFNNELQLCGNKGDMIANKTTG